MRVEAGGLRRPRGGAVVGRREVPEKATPFTKWFAQPPGDFEIHTDN